MPVNVPPFALRGPEAAPFAHSAALDRRMYGTMWDAEGVIVDAARDGASSLAVTANGTPNMTVNVAQGEGVILADGQRTNGQGVGYYLFATSGVTSVPIVAADTSTRTDLIVAEVIDETYAGATGSSTARLRAIKGTPGAGVPALPDNAIRLAEVTVQSTDTTIVAARVVDRRTPASRYGASRIAALESRPSARMYKTAAQPGVTAGDITMQAVEQMTNDTSITFSGNRLSVPVTGVYQLSAQVTTQMAAAAQFDLLVMDIANARPMQESCYAAAAGFFFKRITAVVRLTAGNDVRLYYSGPSCTISDQFAGTSLTLTRIA